MSKKLLSTFLAVTILLCSLPLCVGAEEETEEYIYYSELFFGYPEHLINDPFLNNYMGGLHIIFDSVHESYVNSPAVFGTGLENALDTIASPSDITKLITDFLGLTDFTYNDALDAANDSFARNIVSDSTFADLENSYGKPAEVKENIKSIITFFGDFAAENGDSKKQSAEEYLRLGFTFLKDKGLLKCINSTVVDTIANTIFNDNFSIDGYFSQSQSAIDIAQAIVVSLLMEDTRLEIVDEILATQEKGTVLYDGMTRLKNQLNGGFVDYFIKNYLTNKIADKICSVINNYITSGDTYMLVKELAKKTKEVITKFVDFPDFDSVLEWQVLMCYSEDLEEVIRTYPQKFTEGPQTSDEIFKYEKLFIAYDAINKTALSLTKDIAAIGDPFGVAYAVLTKAVERGVEEVTIKSGLDKYTIPSSMSESDFYDLMTGKAFLHVAGLQVIFGKEIEVSNGTETVKVPIKANILCSVFRGSLAENHTLISQFESSYSNIAVYETHINSTKNHIITTPKEDRLMLSDEVCNSWTYNLSGENAGFYEQSDAVSQNGVYAVNGKIRSNISLSSTDITFCDTVTINGNLSIYYATLTVNGSLEVSGNISSNINSTLTNNGRIKCGSLGLSHSSRGGDIIDIYNNSYFEVVGDIISVNYKYSYSTPQFYQTDKDAVLAVRGNISIYSEYTFENVTGGTVLLCGTEQQSVKNLTAETIRIDNKSTEGISFSTLTVTDLFDHRGNNFNLPSNAVIPDFDGDGIIDTLDIYPTVSTAITGNIENWIAGDVDGDYAVSSVDLILIKRVLINSYKTNKLSSQSADLNSDGDINSIDINMMKRKMVGAI